MSNLSEMTTAAWAHWLEAALLGNRLDPPLQRSNRELHQDLLALFRDLPAEPALRMADAVGELIRVTPLVTVFAERLYTLLEVAATVKPQRICQYLDRALRSEVGRQLFYANSDLHSRLLTAVGRYDVDDRLIDYIDESAWRIREWPYALRGFRVASLKSAVDAGRLLPLLAELIIDDNQSATLHTQQLGVQIAAVLLQHGHGEMTRVFLDYSERNEIPATAVLASAVIQAIEIAGLPHSPKMAALRVVLLRSAEVVLGSIPLQHLWDVARHHQDAGASMIERAVKHIWRCEAPRYAESPPWEIVTKLDEFLPNDKNFTNDGDWIFRARATPVQVDSKKDLVAFAVIAAIAARHQRTSEVSR